ncbi:MAG: hypothetical protein AB7P40_24360, partial [Chloroflexota bacterium]
MANEASQPGGATAVVAERATGRRTYAQDEGSGGRVFLTRTLRFWSTVLETRLVGTGLWILALVLFCALFADVISPYPRDEQDYLAITEAPTMAHPLGTDDLGRDILTRVIYGSRVSLQVGVI